MKRIIGTFSRGKLLLLLAAGGLLYMSFGSFMVSLKPAKNFEEIIEEGVDEGDHIAGDILYLMDSFAVEQSWNEKSDGTMALTGNSAYYYVVPAGHQCIGIRIRQEDVSAAEKLVAETYAFFSGENVPTTEIAYEGEVRKMEDVYPEMIALFEEQLSYFGYSDEEIEAMGEPLVLERRDFAAVRWMMAAGVVLLVLAALWIGAGIRKANRWVQAKEDGDVIVVKRKGDDQL